MTAAMVREAARLIAHLPDEEIVSFVELGSEGAVLYMGQPLQRVGPKYLIARDGTSLSHHVYEEQNTGTRDDS